MVSSGVAEEQKELLQLKEATCRSALGLRRGEEIHSGLMDSLDHLFSSLGVYATGGNRYDERGPIHDPTKNVLARGYNLWNHDFTVLKSKKFGGPTYLFLGPTSTEWKTPEFYDLIVVSDEIEARNREEMLVVRELIKKQAV